MKKFNGFERMLIHDAVSSHLETMKAETIEMEKTGKTPLFTPDYFTMVKDNLLKKVDTMTLKKFLQDENII